MKYNTDQNWLIKMTQEELNNSLLNAVKLQADNKQIKELLDKGANVNTEGSDGRTLLHIATLNKKYDLMKLLIDNGAKLLVEDKQGNYPVEYTTSSDQEAIEIWLKAGIYFYAFDEKCIMDDKIIGFFKEAIDRKDAKTIKNLCINFRYLMNDAISYATSEGNDEMLETLKNLIIDKEKINQRQLNKIIGYNSKESELNFKDLLEANHYSNDLEDLKIDGRNFNEHINTLDLSNLTLKGSYLHNLAASEISFKDSDLTNANITFQNKNANIKFPDANLTHTYISGMDINQANFENTTIKDTMIWNSSNTDVNLTEKQKLNKLEFIDLMIQTEHSFNQRYLTNKSDVFDQGGVCMGLCVELARYTLMSQQKGEGYGNYLEKIRKKIKNPSINFVYRIQSYQDKLQKQPRYRINTKEINNNKFFENIPKDVASSDILGCSVSVGDEGSHIFAIIKLRDDKGDICGYQIFDPNLGYISTKNEQELNKQINILHHKYQEKTNQRNSMFYIRALDDIVKEHGLIHPKDVNFTIEEKSANKARKYSMMSNLENLYMTIESDKSTPEALAKAKEQIENMDITQINHTIKQSKESTSLLKLAIKGNKVDIVDTLIKKGAQINTSNITASSLLSINKIKQFQYESEKNELNLSEAQKIEGALKSAGAELNIFDAVLVSDDIAIKKLLEKQIDLNTEKSANGKTILFHAIDNDYLYYDGIKLLLDHGANIDIKDENGISLIRYASSNTKHKEYVVGTLLRLGADPAGLEERFVTDEKIIGLFEYAIMSKDPKMMDNLLKHFSHFKDKVIDTSQETLLSFASRNNPSMEEYMRGKGFKPKASIFTRIVKIVEDKIHGFLKHNTLSVFGFGAEKKVSDNNEALNKQQNTESNPADQIIVLDSIDVTQKAKFKDIKSKLNISKSTKLKDIVNNKSGSERKPFAQSR